MLEQKKLNCFLLLLLYLFSTSIVLGQSVDPDGPEGPPPAPINEYLLLLVGVGIVFSWYVLKKNSSVIIDNN